MQVPSRRIGLRRPRRRRTAARRRRDRRRLARTGGAGRVLLAHRRDARRRHHPQQHVRRPKGPHAWPLAHSQTARVATHPVSRRLGDLRDSTDRYTWLWNWQGSDPLLKRALTTSAPAGRCGVGPPRGSPTGAPQTTATPDSGRATTCCLASSTPASYLAGSGKRASRPNPIRPPTSSHSGIPRTTDGRLPGFT